MNRTGTVKPIQPTKKRRAPKTAFKKGNKMGKGRPPGVPNKITTDLKRALINALDRAGGTGGGEQYFFNMAKRDPKTFSTLIGRCIPSSIVGKNDGPLEVLVTKAQTGLADLTDKDLQALKAILTKVGIGAD